MIDWKYPDQDPIPDKVDERFIIEFEFTENSKTIVLRSTRGSDGWFVDGTLRYIPDRYLGDSIKIIAYMPYTKPEPPEKPQDCPFCGAKMVHNDTPRLGGWQWCECNSCNLRTPDKKTKAEAIKALNSIRVVKS